MVKIKVKGDYASIFRMDRLGFVEGAEPEVSEEVADFLLRDAPLNFEFPGEFLASRGKGPVSPPMDKMIEEGEALDKLPVAELKARLKAKGLPVGGKKEDLIARLEG